MKHLEKRMLYSAQGFGEMRDRLEQERRDTGYDTSPQKYNMHSIKEIAGYALTN